MALEIRELSHTQVANLGRAVAVVDDQLKQAKELVEKHFPGATHEQSMAMTTGLVQALAAVYAGHTAAGPGR